MAHILLVDDDASIRSSLSRVLETHGHAVEPVEDGQLALARLRLGAYDLVITDINMPEATGIEVLAHVYELSPNVPVIAMSGGGRVLDKGSLLGDAFALGAAATIEKPIEIVEFVALVEKVLSDGA